MTTIRTAPGDGARLRRWCADIAGLTLGIGLSVPGVDPDSLFRIGHMGHLNPPMLLGTLATIEAGLPRPRDPRTDRAGVEAAAAVIAAAGGAGACAGERTGNRRGNRLGLGGGRSGKPVALAVAWAAAGARIGRER